MSYQDFKYERLERMHRRKDFCSGQFDVDDWLRTKALQHQEKHLSVTKVLVDSKQNLIGYFTLASGQVDFSELPLAVSKKLPKRLLPVAILAWLGVHKEYQGAGIGKQLLAQALNDCFLAGQTFPFIAVLLDCIDINSKNFYQQFDFQELSGHPYRLFLSIAQLKALVDE